SSRRKRGWRPRRLHVHEHPRSSVSAEGYPHLIGHILGISASFLDPDRFQNRPNRADPHLQFLLLSVDPNPEVYYRLLRVYYLLDLIRLPEGLRELSVQRRIH